MVLGPVGGWCAALAEGTYSLRYMRVTQVAAAQTSQGAFSDDLAALAQRIERELSDKERLLVALDERSNQLEEAQKVLQCVRALATGM
jgi:prophage DNA circulation protein